MKLSELITESVTFSAAGHEPSQVKRYKEKCFLCGGDGVEYYFDAKNKEYYDNMEDIPKDNIDNVEPIKCRACNGEGETEETDVGPELNVANRNANVLLQVLGFEVDPSDLYGQVDNSKLPELRRTIIKLLNKDGISRYSIEPHKSGGNFDRRSIKGDDGITRIAARKTSGMYDMGLSEERIRRYLTDMLEIIEYAQKNSLDISWG